MYLLFIAFDTYVSLLFSDVQLLKEGCEHYRKAMKQTSGIDPFIEAVTGAAAVHLAYRKEFLEEDSVVVVSDHGLQPETQTSAKANAWLAWLMKKSNGLHIQCILNGKEKVMGRYRLDGFVQISEKDSVRLYGHPFLTGKIVLEFNGVCHFSSYLLLCLTSLSVSM